MRGKAAGVDRESQWLKGVLDLAVLAVLERERSAYGYTIVESLAEAGLPGIKGGTLYPLLARLDDEGLVESSWVNGGSGPARKYFALTPAGHAALDLGRTGWSDFVVRATSALEGQR